MNSGIFVIKPIEPECETMFLDVFLWNAEYEFGFKFHNHQKLDGGVSILWLGNDEGKTACYVLQEMKTPIKNTEYLVLFKGGRYA